MKTEELKNKYDKLIKKRNKLLIQIGKFKPTHEKLFNIEQDLRVLADLINKGES